MLAALPDAELEAPAAPAQHAMATAATTIPHRRPRPLTNVIIPLWSTRVDGKGSNSSVGARNM